MSNTIRWPADLPCDVLVENFQHAFGDNLIRTEMDAGPAKRRRRYTRAVDKMQVDQVMTRHQLTRFQWWFREVLKDGVNEFLWINPISQSTIRLAFTGTPTWQPLGNAVYWRVNLPMEVL